MSTAGYFAGVLVPTDRLRFAFDIAVLQLSLKFMGLSGEVQAKSRKLGQPGVASWSCFLP